MKSKTELWRKWPRLAYVGLHAVSGVYAGACLSIALVDVPSIQALADGTRALAFLRLALPAMGSLMLPQLVLMTLLMTLLTVRAAKRGDGMLPRALIPLTVVLGIVLVTVVVHIPLNRRFLAGSVTISEVLPLLRRWLAFHWLRTLLALALPYCIVRYLRRAANHSPPGRASIGEDTTTQRAQA
jgi:hypothetical protein